MRSSLPFLLLLAGCAGDPRVVHAPAGDIHTTAIDLPAGGKALGIEYATATGDAPSTAAPRATTTLAAASFGTACAGTVTTRATGDDCLRLSVWSPDLAPATPAPVLVYVPSGGEDLASSTYDGGTFAHIGGVLVTVQHRAPPLGVHATSAADIARTDAGLGDVVLALAWARANAAAFGGDPAQLLVFGDGEGAGLVCALLAAGRLGGARVALMGGTCLDVPAGRFASLPRAPSDVFADAATTLPPLVTGFGTDEPASVSCAARHLAATWDARGAAAFVYEMSYGTMRVARSELPFVFGNPPAGHTFTGDESSIVYDVMSTWVDFAHDGDPTGPATSSWPRWTRAAPMRATFAAGLPVVADAVCP